MTTKTYYQVRFVYGGSHKEFYHCAGHTLVFDMETAIREGIDHMKWINKCQNQIDNPRRIKHLEIVPLDAPNSAGNVKRKYRVDIIEFLSKRDGKQSP
jgi:hypothetical protein